MSVAGTATSYKDWQPTRAYEELRKCLVDYFNLREGGHLAPREDKLGTQRIKQEDASFVGVVGQRVDAETALLRCGASFEEKMITFQYLSGTSKEDGKALGGTPEMAGIVARRWAVPHPRKRRVRAITANTLSLMVEYLTGVRPD